MGAWHHVFRHWQAYAQSQISSTLEKHQGNILKIDKSILLESLVGSLVLAFGGIATVILAGKANSVEISLYQAIGMNAFFFCTRLLGLIPTRYCFKRWGKK
jgi:hypothetical protein